MTASWWLPSGQSIPGDPKPPAARDALDIGPRPWPSPPPSAVAMAADARAHSFARWLQLHTSNAACAATEATHGAAMGLLQARNAHIASLRAQNQDAQPPRLTAVEMLCLMELRRGRARLAQGRRGAGGLPAATRRRHATSRAGRTRSATLSRAAAAPRRQGGRARQGPGHRGRHAHAPLRHRHARPDRIARAAT